MALISQASTILSDKDHEDPDQASWLKNFGRLIKSINITSHELTSVLSLLSASVTSGNPLPPYLKAPEPYKLSAKLEAIDPDILHVSHVAEPGYAAFAVMQIASSLISDDVGKLISVPSLATCVQLQPVLPNVVQIQKTLGRRSRQGGPGGERQFKGHRPVKMRVYALLLSVLPLVASLTTTTTSTSKSTTSKPTITTTSTSKTSSSSTSTCKSDNCLRALITKSSLGAEYFCSWYTTATTSLTETPYSTAAFETPCGNEPARITSACSCQYPPPSCPTPNPNPKGRQVVQDADFEHDFSVYKVSPQAQGRLVPGLGRISPCSICTGKLQDCTAFQASPNVANDGTSVVLTQIIPITVGQQYLGEIYVGVQNATDVKSSFSLTVNGTSIVDRVAPCTYVACQYLGGSNTVYENFGIGNVFNGVPIPPGTYVQNFEFRFEFFFDKGAANTPLLLDDFQLRKNFVDSKRSLRYNNH
ncbi:MAG: hypothetical protein Q9220_007007 [cf. Caloplaca sp. 1 TL-2023]